MSRYIDADALLNEVNRIYTKHFAKSREQVVQDIFRALFKRIEAAHTVDAVEVEKYNELREAFVDFVCSGIHNPAPYCKNRCEECIDAYGWCKANACTGFNPDGERRTDDE